MIKITDIKPIGPDTWTFRWNGDRMYYRTTNTFTEVYAPPGKGPDLKIRQHMPINPHEPERSILDFLKLAMIV